MSSSMSVASNRNLTDSWDQPATAGFSSSSRRTVPSQAVPDDWDDDNDEEEDPQELWDAANRKAPMPELIISSTATSVVSPPPAAIQPTLRILKRPSSAASPSNSPSPSLSETKKTLAEREAEYQAARERIFKESGPSAGGDGATRAKIIREPKGPDSDSQSTNSGLSRGFGKRVPKSPPPQLQSQPYPGSGTSS